MTSWNQLVTLAAEEGFEPSQTESESAVLPLHNSAIFYEVFNDLSRSLQLRL